MQSIESTEIRHDQQTADAWSQTVLVVRTMDLMGEQLDNKLARSVSWTMLFIMNFQMLKFKLEQIPSTSRVETDEMQDRIHRKDNCTISCSIYLRRHSNPHCREGSKYQCRIRLHNLL